jgi:hypothetical protein
VIRADSRRAFVDGIALWSPRLPGWEVARAVLMGHAEPATDSARRPSPALLPPAERRRAPDAVTLAIEVAAAACESAGAAPSTLASVFATSHGDLAITDYLCSILVTAPLHTSPTRFHNSVHNAAAGYWCIASDCHAPYTTVSVAGFTCAAGLLEALVQVAADARPVLFVAYDTGACGPLAKVVTSRGLLGVALVLAPERSERTIVGISWSVRHGNAAEAIAPRPAYVNLVGDNAMAPSLPLFEALARRAGTVTLALGPGALLELDVNSAA